MNADRRSNIINNGMEHHVYNEVCFLEKISRIVPTFRPLHNRFEIHTYTPRIADDANLDLTTVFPNFVLNHKKIEVWGIRKRYKTT